MLSVVLPLAVGLVGPLAGPLGGRPALVRPAAALGLAPLGPVMQFGRSSRRSVEEPSEELVAAFRLLGISEDATYDQVESAYAELLERYKGQTKQTIKLQVAKDKILDYRLRQRMSGALRPDRKFGEDLRPADAKKPLITLPAWLEEIAELPKKTYLITNVVVFSGLGLLPLFSKTFISSSISLSFGFSLLRLYNRGAPETNNEESLQMLSADKKALLTTVGICTFALLIGGLLSQLLKMVLVFLAEEVSISLAVSAALCFACSFFKVQAN